MVRPVCAVCDPLLCMSEENCLEEGNKFRKSEKGRGGADNVFYILKGIPCHFLYFEGYPMSSLCISTGSAVKNVLVKHMCGSHYRTKTLKQNWHVTLFVLSTLYLLTCKVTVRHEY